MDIYQQKVFRIFTKLSQGRLRHESLINGDNNPIFFLKKLPTTRNGISVHRYGIDCKYEYSKERKTCLLSIPKPFNPIHKTDMPLDKLLELRPEFRYKRDNPNDEQIES